MNDKVGLDIIRTIAATLDKAVYWIISVAYEVIKELASIDVFKDSSSFAMRVYTLIGLFMIFRISFALINYLINPDSITDKEKGGGNLIKKIVITFVLIIMTPQAFVLLKDAQNAILEDKVLERFFLGEAADGTGLAYQMDERCGGALAKSEGDYIALLVFRPFYQLEQEGTTASGAALDAATLDLFASTSGYCNADSVNSLLKFDIYNAPTSGSAGSSFGVYRVNYWFIISSLVGGVVAVLMVGFCMDVAARSIKLGFLEIISPIPIISYMDPSQSKNGMFKKWLSEVGKTWADLFIRLGALYFAVNIISSLDNIWTISSDMNHKFWVFVFIIIGALIFAKKLPSLIESILGIKLSGALTLNPLKKLSTDALGGKAAAGLIVGAGTIGAATIGGASANLLNNYKNRGKGDWNLKNNLKGVGSGLVRGAYHGATVGYGAGASGKYNTLKTSFDSIQKSSENRNLAKALVEQGVVKPGILAKQRYLIKDKYTDVIGYQGKGGSTDELKERLNQISVEKGLAEDSRRRADESLARYNTNSSEIFKTAVSQFNPFDRTYATDTNGNIQLTDKGTVNWNKNIESVDDFLRNNPITFNNATEESRFRSEYIAMSSAEQQYRDSYNELLKLNKEETKLTKQKTKFEEAKTKASNSK